MRSDLDIYHRLRAGFHAGKGGPQGPVKTALRLEVEAAGVPWELYRERRRRGATHEQAMAGVDRRRVKRNPHAAATAGGVTSQEGTD